MKKKVRFHAPIFTKLINSQHHYVQIPYTQYHPNQAISVVSMETYLTTCYVEHNKFMGTSPALNFIQSVRKMQKIR
jgi:hypothetical protein